MSATATLAALTVALLIGQDVPAAQTPSAPGPQEPPPATTLADVVVLGQPLRRQVQMFVDEITAPPRGHGVSRWDRRVCVGVANLTGEVAQHIIDRVSRVALDVGLEAGAPGCSPNILIIATDDGSALATALVEAHPRVFRPNYSGASGSRLQLSEFQAGDRPVRWWHVSVPVDADSGHVAVRLPGEVAPQRHVHGGLLRSDTRYDFRRAFIIVDLNQTGDVSTTQLGDYIAMVAFAQIDPEAETAGYDTVLNLFAGTGASEGLTEWDASYLTSLYDAELNQREQSHQTGAVSSAMAREREAAAEADRP